MARAAPIFFKPGRKFLLPLNKDMKRRQILRGLILALSILSLSTDSLYAQAPFYQGKTITIIISTDAGGTATSG